MKKKLELSLKGRELPAGGILTKEGAQAHTDEDWQRAQRRVLCYLQMLEIPALETLELAIEALRRAKQEVMRGESNPTAESMRALRRLLLAHRHMSSSSIPSPENVRNHWFGQQNLGQAEIRSMPPLKRGFMTPREG